MGVEKYKSYGSNVSIDEERSGRESLYESGIVKPVSKLTSEFTIENTNIEPIIESNNKGLQSNVFQPVDSSPTIIVANNDGGGEIGDDQTVRVPANQPNTLDSGVLVMTDDPSSFLKTIKNEQLNIANSNILPHQVAQNLK